MHVLRAVGSRQGEGCGRQGGRKNRGVGRGPARPEAKEKPQESRRTLASGELTFHFIWLFSLFLCGTDARFTPQA